MIIKPKNISYLVPSVILLLVIFGNYSCKKITNPNSDLNIKDTLKYDYIETRVFVEFKDAATGEYITSNQGDYLTVEVLGKSNNVVADIIGIQEEFYYPQEGLISFGLLPEFIPTTASPISFTIKASIYDYITHYKEVNISERGDYYISVSMINISEPPTGVIIEALDNVGNLYNGVVFDDVTISTPGQEATFIIPSGTKLVADDNTNLSGRLNLTLVYHDLNTDNGFRTAQMGVNSTIIKDNSLRNVLFGAGGFVDFYISDSDFKYAAFIQEKQLRYAVKVNSSITNPNTGSSYIPGNQINFCSLDADTGMWVYQKRDSIKAGYFAHGSTSKPGSYVFGNFTESACNSSSSFKITDGCNNCTSSLLRGIMRNSSDNSFIYDLCIAGSVGINNYMSGTSGEIPVYIDWSDNLDSNSCIVNPAFSPTNIDNMCGQGSINLPLESTIPGLSISVEASFFGQCPIDTNYLILPSIGAWVRSTTSSSWNWYSVINGKAQICNLIPSETYIVGTYINSSWQEWEIIATPNKKYIFKAVISDDVCTNVFGIL